MEDPDNIMAKADKKAAGRSGFALWTGSNNYEDAVDLYTQAANAFRLRKRSKDAGNAFEKAASVQLKTDEKDDVPNTLVEAFKCYRKDYPKDAARVLQEAIKYFTQKGNFRRGANYMSDLGSLFELELGDNARAVECYEESADWYSNDQAEALSNKATIKAAEISALVGQYPRAIGHFEHVGKGSINNQLTKWSVKEHFLKAGLCHLASGDLVATRRAIDRYIELDTTFQGTREQKLLEDIASAVEQGDPEEFARVVYEYDQLSKLDKWKTTILLKIKNTISEEPDLT